MSLGLRVNVGAHISVIKIVKNSNWLEKGIINRARGLDFYQVLDGYAVRHVV